MSYARLSDDSDVYVFMDPESVLRCHWCARHPADQDWHTSSPLRMVLHLIRHRRGGDRTGEAIPLILKDWAHSSLSLRGGR